MNNSNKSGRNRLIHKYSFTLFFFFMLIILIPSIIVSAVNNPNRSSNNLLIQQQSLLKKQSVTSSSSSLTLGWITGNGETMAQIADYQNLKIVSPALASIDNDDALHVTAEPNTIDSLHKQGKKVWVRLIMKTDTKTSIHKLLTNSTATQAVINKVCEAASKGHWDGVNVDIENVDVRDRNQFSQFIEQMSNRLKQSNTVLSIDLPPDPKAGNQKSPFDHAVLGKYCNYVVFMGYDQHWSTDPTPGPITSLPWLKSTLQEFIQTGIPSKEIILGLPAYTRIWEQDKQGYIVKDPAYSVDYVANLVTQNHRNLSWNSALGEYNITYSANNMYYKIWLPTAISYHAYLNLISKLHLAGSAIWNLDFMNADYWNLIY